MRSDAVLSRLTEEQQADLFDWLTIDTYDVVLKRIAQPPPKGFGIKTHINSLYRFYEQRQAQLRAADLAALVNREGEAPDEPTSRAAASEEGRASLSQRAVPFLSAAGASFAHATYVLANSPSTPANYRALSRTLHHHDDIAIKREYIDIARQQLALGRERLQLEKTQFEYNAARAALALLPELNAIDQMRDIDDESKIWRVRDRLFGTDGTALVSGAPQSAPSVSSAVHNDLK